MTAFFQAFTAFASALLRSNAALAVSAVCMVTFAAQSLVAPERPPPFGALSIAQLGLPADLPDLGEVGRQAQDAARAARPYLGGADADPPTIPPGIMRTLNLLGLGGSLALMVLTLGLQSRRHRDDAGG